MLVKKKKKIKKDIVKSGLFGERERDPVFFLFFFFFFSFFSFAFTSKEKDSIKMAEKFEMLINGKMVAGAETYEVINPAKGEVFAEAPHASKEQVHFFFFFFFFF